MGGSEVAGSAALGLVPFVQAFRAICRRDVAEAAFLRAGHAGCLLFCRQPADQRTEVLYELVVHSLRRYVDRVVQVGGLPPEFESPVTLQRSRDGVQVNPNPPIEDVLQQGV